MSQLCQKGATMNSFEKLAHQQLQETTEMLLVSGVGDYLSQVVGSDIGLFGQSHPEIAARTRLFLQAELPMTVIGEREFIDEDEAQEVGVSGEIMDIRLVKVTPKLEIFGGYTETICSTTLQDDQIGEIIPDSYDAPSWIDFCRTAIDIYKRQLEFGWTPTA